VPTYDYRCAACGLEVEVTHGIHAHGPTTCTACGGAMRKALSTPAIHFKGSGWAKKDARAAAKAPSSTSPSTGAESKSGSTDGPTSPASSAKSDAAAPTSAAGASAGGDTARSTPSGGA
jgi:putative FmdB family regulatory protein